MTNKTSPHLYRATRATPLIPVGQLVALASITSPRVDGRFARVVRVTDDGATPEPRAVPGPVAVPLWQLRDYFTLERAPEGTRDPLALL